MAETKSVLFELGVDISKTLDSLAKYEIEIENTNEKIGEFQKKQKAGIKLNEEERTELIRLKEVKKALQKEYNDQSRQVQNVIVAEGKYKDTLKGLSAELSTAKDRLRAMKLSGEENSKAYQEQSKYVDALNTRIKEMEAAYGVHTRSVGDYEIATKSLRTQMRELTDQLVELKLAGKDNTAEYQEASDKLAEMRDAMGDVNEQTNNLASDTIGIDRMAQSIGTMLGAVNLLSLGLGEEAKENEKVQKTLKALQVATTALAIATQLKNNFEKQGILYQTAQNIQTKASIALQKLQAKRLERRLLHRRF